MLEGFKKFIARGNMIDMAVGVVMGGAVTTVVNSIVNSVINPFIAMIFGKPNMDGLLAITFGVRYLNVIDHGEVVEAPAEAAVPAAMAPSSYR